MAGCLQFLDMIVPWPYRLLLISFPAVRARNTKARSRYQEQRYRVFYEGASFIACISATVSKKASTKHLPSFFLFNISWIVSLIHSNLGKYRCSSPRNQLWWAFQFFLSMAGF